MHVRRRFAGHITLLVALCILIGFNTLTAQVSHASSPPRHKPDKDTLSILPKKLISQSRVPANTISLYESTTNASTMYNQGCSAAHGAPGLIILDWGQPVYLGNNTYGTTTLADMTIRIPPSCMPLPTSLKGSGRAAPVPRTSLSVLVKVTITLVIHSPSQPPRGMPMVSNGAIWSTLCKALSQTITTLSWVPTEPATWRWSGRTLH